MRRDVFFVLLSYGDAHRRAALATLRRCLAQQLGGVAAGVVVDNALGGQLELELDATTTCSSGDNAWREFSGWDRGLAWLDSAYPIRPESVVVLANDTLHRAHWSEYLEGIEPARVREAVARGGLLGRIDAYPRPIEVFGLRVQRWVCSAFVLTTGASVDRLRPFALPFRDEEIFAADVRGLFRRPSPLSENYRSYLRSWLLGDAGELESRWHAAGPPSSTQLDALRGKVRAILCEHHLGARAAALGMPLIDGR